MWFRVAKSLVPMLSRPAPVQVLPAAHRQWAQLYSFLTQRDPFALGARTAPACTRRAFPLQPTRVAGEEPVGLLDGQLYGDGYHSLGQAPLRTPFPSLSTIQLSQTSPHYRSAARHCVCSQDAKQSSQMMRSPECVRNDIAIPIEFIIAVRDYIQIMLNRRFQPDTRKSPQRPQPYYPQRPQEINNRTSQNLKGKPLISPRNIQAHNLPTNNPPSTRTCINHPSKRAEFMAAEEDNCEEYYCGRCAAQLATRGCEVVRLQAAGMRTSKRNQLPHYPQYQHQPIYQQIMEILRLCNSGIGEHTSNMERFSDLSSSYQQQLELTGAFYDRLIEIIEEMKADHLYDLAQERDKYTQIADIENDHLRENTIEINVIKNDIENHLEEVLEGIRESGNAEECRESLEHYRQKLTLFGHQLEEQLESLQGVTRYPQQKIDTMLQEFQNFLKVLWDAGQDQIQRIQPRQPIQRQAPIQQPLLPSQNMNMNNMNQNPNLNSALTVKNIHQILPRGVNQQEGRRAFRNLEQEEQEEPFEERRSPNFKRI